MIRSKSRPRRPRRRLTHDDTPLGPRPRDNSPSFGASHRPPPKKILDRLAEETIHKGFQGPRHPLCPRCFTRRSVSGGCNCPSDVSLPTLKAYLSPTRAQSEISLSTLEA